MNNLKKLLILFLVNSLMFLMWQSFCFAADITGTIKFQGDKPKFKPLATSADPACPGSVYPEVLVLGSNNELANVLVHILKGVPPGKYYSPDSPVVLNQVGCRFEPHVFVAMVGQKVVFLTSDQTLHTVDFHGIKNKKFAVEMPKWHKGGAKVFEKEEFMVPIMCSVHPWMLAFANIVSHPYFFVSEKNGRYLIRDLPPGEYTIEAWHEKLGRQKKIITIESNDQLIVIDFTFRQILSKLLLRESSANDYFIDKENKLAVCSDRCIGGRVEAAFQSATKLANDFKRLTSQ